MEQQQPQTPSKETKEEDDDSQFQFRQLIHVLTSLFHHEYIDWNSFVLLIKCMKRMKEVHPYDELTHAQKQVLIEYGIPDHYNPFEHIHHMHLVPGFSEENPNKTLQEDIKRLYVSVRRSSGHRFNEISDEIVETLTRIDMKKIWKN